MSDRSLFFAVGGHFAPVSLFGFWTHVCDLVMDFVPQIVDATWGVAPHVGQIGAAKFHRSHWVLDSGWLQRRKHEQEVERSTDELVGAASHHLFERDTGPDPRTRDCGARLAVMEL